MFFYVFVESVGNIWEKVSALPDVVHPDFHAVEDLFSQKVFVTETDGAAVKKKSEIVRCQELMYLCS